MSRITGRGRCERSDRLRHDDELVRVAVESEAEPLVRGGAIHAGLAAAVCQFPTEPDAPAVRLAVADEAIARGLSATDPRIETWTRISLRAARALDPAAWEPVRLVAGPDGLGRGDTAEPTENLTAGLVCSEERSADDLPAAAGAGTIDYAGGGDPLVEIRLTVPLPDAWLGGGGVGNGWIFSFKPDAVLRNRASGLIWLLDHKTKSSFSRIDPWTELHLQSLLYVRALREYGVHVAGAVLYQVLADEPTVPALRADGHLAERSWKTDWPTACEVIRRSADPNPDSPRYAALRATIAERRWQFPQEVLFDEAEIESAWSHLLEFRDDLVRADAWAVDDARRLHMPVWRATRASGRGVACDRCDYAAWCAEEFVGRDPEALIGDSYRRGGDKYLAEVALTSRRDNTDYRCHKDFDSIDTTRARP